MGNKDIPYSNRKPTQQGQSLPSLSAKAPSPTSPSIEALCIADLHLSHNPPLARSSEPNWYETQAEYLAQVRKLREDLENKSLRGSFAKKQIPILACGDIVDRWSAPVELVNWMLIHLPKMYSIYGNHDLPYHNPKDLHKSAFYTLVQTGLITLLSPKQPLELGHLRIHPFPFGEEIKPLLTPHDLVLEIALVHSYFWVRGKGHVGASLSQRASRLKDKFLGYDLVISGDNHVSFEYKKLFNVGSLMRRNSDQVDHKPSVGLIYSDGSIKRYYLDVSKDKFLEKEMINSLENKDLDISEFLEELKNLGESALDFGEAVKRKIIKDRINKDTEKIILGAME